MARIDMLIVVAAAHRRDRVLQLLKKLWVLPVDIRLSAAYATSCASARAPIPISAQCRCSTSSTSRSRDWDSVAKRVFDIVFASLGTRRCSRR